MSVGYHLCHGWTGIAEMQRTFVFARDATSRAFADGRFVAASVADAMQATFVGMADIVCEALTDEDDSEPRWSITFLADGVFDKPGDAFVQSFGNNGVMVKNIVSDGR